MSIDYYFIQPNDVWMFRDARPFTAGVDYAARSIFPPTPQTMQGIVRSTALEQRGVTWQRGWAQRLGQPDLLAQLGFDASGSPAQVGNLTIVGPRLAWRKRNGEIVTFNPLPLDLSKSENGINQFAPRNQSVISDAPKGWLPLARKASGDGNNVPGKAADGSFWLNDQGMRAWAQGSVPRADDLFLENELFTYEERTGLALDRTRRTYRRRDESGAQGLMYRARFVRLVSQIGLLIGVTRGVLEDQGTIVIGGEARMAHYTRVDFQPAAFAPPKHGRVKLTLTTPAWWSGGFYPSDGFAPFLGENANLISVALGKHQPIGGWDVNRKQHKPLAQYVPAGSVYFFEGVTRLPDAFTETPPGALDHARIGFGGMVAGEWDYA
jgi:CRISPR-associated protein Cmr3